MSYCVHVLLVLVLLSPIDLSSAIDTDPCSINFFFMGTWRSGAEKWFEVWENAPNGSVVGLVNITGDNSEVTLTYDETQNEFFTFDTTSRNLMVKQSLDVDRQGALVAMEVTIGCLPVDEISTLPFNLDLLINIKDYNDNPPIFHPNSSVITVPEDTPVDEPLGTDLQATDDDHTGRIFYKILPGEYSEYFKINAESKLEITLAKELDFEDTQQMTVEIEARDVPEIAKDEAGPQLSSTATLTVNVQDADDLSPVFTLKDYTGYIEKNAPKGSYVNVSVPIFAQDQDTMRAEVEYTLLDTSGMFSIDNMTGRVWNSKELKSLTVITVPMVVLASQTDNPQRKGFALLIIEILDVNINAPKFLYNIYYANVTENFPIRNTFLTITATDPDYGGYLEYFITERDLRDDISIDNNGRLRLERQLDYETDESLLFHVTASDGTQNSTTTVIITVIDVNDNDPVIIWENEDGTITAEPRKGSIITRVETKDTDKYDSVELSLGNFNNLFFITTDGEVVLQADSEQLEQSVYPLLVLGTDNGQPSRKTSQLITILFPSEKPTAAAVVASAGNDMLAIIFGAVAGLLLVVVIVLIVYIVWRQRRTHEELTKAKAPHAFAARGLTYRQAELPDDLPKMDLRYVDDTDETSEYEGSTTVQHNPLTSVNQAYIQSSGSEMDRDVSEIEIATAVVPYDDDYGYDDQSAYAESGHMSTFGVDDTTSSNSSHSDSTGGSRRGLVPESKATNQMTTWDSDDKIHPHGSQKIQRPDTSPQSDRGPVKTLKSKPQITVYF